jgi:hypothetical protein
MSTPKPSGLQSHARCGKGGKLRYRTRSSAEHALAHLIVHGNPSQVPVRAYRCNSCDGWHLTSDRFRAKAPAA